MGPDWRLNAKISIQIKFILLAIFYSGHPQCTSCWSFYLPFKSLPAAGIQTQTTSMIDHTQVTSDSTNWAHQILHILCIFTMIIVLLNVLMLKHIKSSDFEW